MKEKTKDTAFKTVAYSGITLLCLSVPILGTFLCAFPEWVVLLPAGVLIAFGISQPKKKVAKCLLGVASLVIAAACMFSTYCNPYFGSVIFRNAEQTEYKRVITAKEAKSDLDSAWEWINKRHPAFLHGAPSYMAEAYKNAAESISDDMTVNELNKVISEMLAPLHDAHTSVFGKYSDDSYPKDAASWNGNGLRVVAVNGISRDEMIERAKPHSSYEVEEWISVDAGSSAQLEMIGITFPITYTLEDENGVRSEATYCEDDFISTEEFWEQLKQYEEEPADEQSFVRYEIDSEKSLAILTLDQCKFNAEYRDTLKAMFTEVKERGVENVAVDLRSNGGGNSLVADEFISYLSVESYKTTTYRWRLGPFMTTENENKRANTRYDDLVFDGKVYILTSDSTFSSAMLFAQFISDNALGIVIGEPPANAANSYGDVTEKQLKNSKLVVRSSTKIFRRASGTDENLVMPDIPCPSQEALLKTYEQING